MVQKYLERPLLYKGRKFDIRVWCVAHSCLDFYFYETGYLRTCSAAYTVDEMACSDLQHYDRFLEQPSGDQPDLTACTHLTNNTLQIKNKDTYGQHEEGNVVSFEDFQSYLDETYPEHKLDVRRDFVARMKDMCIDTYLSCKNTLNPYKRRNSFELLGFDFMIDEDFRMWLIEVNTNPSLSLNNKNMKGILPKMFADVFKIVLDPVFEEDMTKEQKDTAWEQTDFDLLYSRSKCVNKRAPIREG